MCDYTYIQTNYPDVAMSSFAIEKSFARTGKRFKDFLLGGIINAGSDFGISKFGLERVPCDTRSLR